SSCSAFLTSARGTYCWSLRAAPVLRHSDQRFCRKQSSTALGIHGRKEFGEAPSTDPNRDQRRAFLPESKSRIFLLGRLFEWPGPAWRGRFLSSGSRPRRRGGRVRRTDLPNACSKRARAGAVTRRATASARRGRSYPA